MKKGYCWWREQMFEQTEVYNLAQAVWGIRYSYASKGDTVPIYVMTPEKYRLLDHCELGSKDLQLVKSLIKAGPSHRKFMRQILVSTNIIAPRYWWMQFDTYKVGVTSNSESTMHTLMKRPLELSDFAFVEDEAGTEQQIVALCEKVRESGDFERLITLLPQSYIQKRLVTMNYEVIKAICEQRRGHKVKEWAYFIKWAEEELPYGDIFFKKEEKK